MGGDRLHERVEGMGLTTSEEMRNLSPSNFSSQASNLIDGVDETEMSARQYCPILHSISMLSDLIISIKQ